MVSTINSVNIAKAILLGSLVGIPIGVIIVLLFTPRYSGNTNASMLDTGHKRLAARRNYAFTRQDSEMVAEAEDLWLPYAGSVI